ncbi:MAG: SgcJ/EcaC family oxidoreductase [Bacteroidetes bacterium]|jgi:uncharacterized protein (TIGR02246 family)|nr:SgcJ/EcaC family oxidoreductase [Bacteroidota bacterium]
MAESTTPPTEPDDALHRPERLPEAFVAAWNDRDPERIGALFDEDAEFVNVTGLWWHNRAAIQKAHAYGLERIFSASTLTLLETRVKRLSPRIAVVHAKMEMVGQSAADGVEAPRTRRTIFSFVVHDTPGGWRCASAHNTDVVPGAETNLLDDEGRLRPVSYRRPHTP